MKDMICVSGGFDPLHGGHLAMFRDAAQHGSLCVIINSDPWLIRKKGFTFLDWEQRAAIISDLRYVDRVSQVDDTDGTVCEALRRLKPRYFANGGDRKQTNTPEIAVCDELGIELLWGIGGEKTESSSEVARRSWVTRSWGKYVTLDMGDGYQVKKLILDPGKSISLQYHHHRREFWYVAEGHARVRLNDQLLHVEKGAFPVGVDKGMIHQLFNESEEPLILIEIQSGDYLGEDDIVRISKS